MASHPIEHAPFADLPQAFMAGANAIFTGERMLTTDCPGWDEDKEMLGRWGMRGLRSFEDQEGRNPEHERGNLLSQTVEATTA